MDIKKLKAEFEKLKYIEEKLEYLNFDEHLDCYVEKSNGMPVGLAAWVNGAFYGFEQAAKAQAVPKWISVEDKLPELKEHTWRTALPVNVMIDGYGQYLCYPCQDGNGVFYWADATCYGNDKGEHPIKCDRDTDVLNVTHWMPLPDAPQEPAND
ncbi:DUF551 domain-containing protein [Acinetobacter pragensis]|uniref:DUF551 domain-containing protein n=1 Tax=Acinetobacter pragensis TaxID=1806892 RepID=UPI003340D675